jgi:protein-tyrosine-phosphatase
MKVLFVCRSNAERSQIAEAIFNRLSKRNRAVSAGVAVKENEIGLPPGRIVSELMLGAGYQNFLRLRRKQITEGMLSKADMIVVLMWRSERKQLTPKYLHLDGKRVSYWKLGTGRLLPKDVYDSFPPYTYKYHAEWIFDIEAHVKRLVREIR